MNTKLTTHLPASARTWTGPEVAGKLRECLTDSGFDNEKLREQITDLLDEFEPHDTPEQK